MKFQTKILLVTLIILVSTLVLNSVLSLASFEKIYVTSLISIFEVSGKNLKRKIETSLRLGKPMDKFEGMDRLLSEVMANNPQITDVGVGNRDGNILYHSSPQKVGTRFNPPLPAFTGPDQVHSQLIRNQYVTFLPLADRSNAIVGAVSFSFPQSVIYDRLREMAYDNLTILWNIMLSFSIGLIVFIAVLVARPIRKDLIAIADRLAWPPKSSCAAADNLQPSHVSDMNSASQAHAVTESSQAQNSKYLNIGQIRNELDRLDFHLMGFISKAAETLDKVEILEREKQTFMAAIDDCAETYEQVKINYQKVSENSEVAGSKTGAVLQDTEKILAMLSIASQALTGSEEERMDSPEQDLTT